MPTQSTVTVPGGGCVNVNVYGPAPLPVTKVALSPLMLRSSASTPVTASLNVIAMLESVLTVVPGVGVVVVTEGAALALNASASPKATMLEKRQQRRGDFRMREFTRGGVFSR